MFLGRVSQLSRRIHRHGIPHGSEHWLVGGAVCIREAMRKIQSPLFGQFFHGTHFAFTEHCFAKNPPGPSSADFFQLGRANMEFHVQSIICEFRLQMGSDGVCQWLERPADQHDGVT